MKSNIANLYRVPSTAIIPDIVTELPAQNLVTSSYRFVANDQILWAEENKLLDKVV